MNIITNFKKNITRVGLLTFVLFIHSQNLLLAATHNGSDKKFSKIGGLGNKNFQEIVKEFILLALKYTLTLLVGLTVLMFAFGLMKYMFKGQSSDTARSEGRQLMLWGVIGLFVMTSVWGLVAIFASVIGHQGVLIPQF